MSESFHAGAGAPRGRRFATTRWSIVLGAADSDADIARSALEVLCRTYWYPLYAYARRTGASADDAQDLTQGFFARFVEKAYIKDVHRERGTFRSFMLASFRHYISNQRARAKALKRGGGIVPVPIDAVTAEERYGNEPAHEMTAERVYERRWALTVLEQALAALRVEYEAGGRLPVFQALKGGLTGAAVPRSYADIASALGMSEGAVKVAAHRLRRRYRAALRRHVGETVADPSAVDDELRYLLRCL